MTSYRRINEPNVKKLRPQPAGASGAGDHGKICGATWVYNPEYAHPPHANHTCGLIAGHKADGIDHQVIHQCLSCQSWASDTLVKLQRT